MKANDVRIGNLCYYHVFDKLNEPQEYDVENIIDAVVKILFLKNLNYE